MRRCELDKGNRTTELLIKVSLNSGAVVNHLYDRKLISYLGGWHGCIEQLVENTSEAFAGRVPTISFFNPTSMYNPSNVTGICWKIIRNKTEVPL